MRLSRTLTSVGRNSVFVLLSCMGVSGVAQAGSAPVASTAVSVAPSPMSTPISRQQERQFHSLLGQWKALDQASGARASVPSRRPIDNFRYTSAFGIRSDPFHRTAAMHAGVDLAAPTGTPVHATANGVVSRAEVAPGYGNLVQINHGASIQTRYGHLSRIFVTLGQRVRRGEVIALVGSTGRSTGSHLHYEVRIADQSINPLPYMAHNDDQLALQQTVGPTSGQSFAVGGPDTDAD